MAILVAVCLSLSPSLSSLSPSLLSLFSLSPSSLSPSSLLSLSLLPSSSLPSLSSLPSSCQCRQGGVVVVVSLVPIPLIVVRWGLGSLLLPLLYAEDGGCHHHAAVEVLRLSSSCRWSGAIVAGLAVVLSTQGGVALLTLRVLWVVVVSGELTGWCYLPCGSCQGWHLEKIEVL